MNLLKRAEVRAKAAEIKQLGSDLSALANKGEAVTGLELGELMQFRLTTLLERLRLIVDEDTAPPAEVPPGPDEEDGAEANEEAGLPFEDEAEGGEEDGSGEEDGAV